VTFEKSKSAGATCAKATGIVRMQRKSIFAASFNRGSLPWEGKKNPTTVCSSLSEKLPPARPTYTGNLPHAKSYDGQTTRRMKRRKIVDSRQILILKIESPPTKINAKCHRNGQMCPLSHQAHEVPRPISCAAVWPIWRMILRLVRGNSRAGDSLSEKLVQHGVVGGRDGCLWLAEDGY